MESAVRWYELYLASGITLKPAVVKSEPEPIDAVG